MPKAHFEFEMDSNPKHPGITVEDEDEFNTGEEPTRVNTEEQESTFPPIIVTPSSSSSKKAIKKPSLASRLPFFLAWIPPHFNWKGARPVIRSTVAAWCGLVLILDSRSEAVLGQASFLILVVAAISPAASPIATVIEQTFWQALFVALAWVWSIFGLYLSHISRTQFKYSLEEFDKISAAPYISQGLSEAAISTAIQEDIFHGAYLETGSSAICCVFLGVGVGFLLWLRGKLGPGPILFGIIFSIIILTINLTIAVLFPYTYFGIGTLFYIPFACQLAINLVVSFLILPETLAHQFSDRLISTLIPLQSIIQQQKEMLAANPRSDEWLEFRSIKQSMNSSMAALTLLATSETNLTRELSFARVSGKDLTKILTNMRVLVSRSTGFVSFYEIIEKHLHREFSDSKGGPAADALVIHLGHSRPPSAEHSPSSSRAPSRPPSPPLGFSKNEEGEGRLSSEQDHLAHLQLPSPNLIRDHNIPLHSPSPLSAPPMDVDSNHEQELFPPNSHSNSLPHSAPHSTPHSAPHSTRPSSTTSTSDLHTTNHEEELSSSNRPEFEHHTSYLNRFHFNHLTGGNGSSSRPKSHKEKKLHHHKSGSHISLPSLFMDAFHSQSVRPVGLMESQRYMDLEDFLSNPRDEEHLEEIISLLSTASSELLEVLDKATGHLIATIHRLKWTEKSWRAYFIDDTEEHNKFIAESEKVLQEVEVALEAYREVKRLEVLTPFASLFDPNAAKDRVTYSSPSHRGMFWCMQFQYSLLGWSEAFHAVLKETTTIDKKRRKARFWFPEWTKFRYSTTTGGPLDDERPDLIPGLSAGLFSSPRNPDYVPPTTQARKFAIRLYNTTEIFSSSDFLFGLKAAVLISLISLPAFFPQTCYFFYTERGIWVCIMAALTLTQYVGDSAFGFTIRIIGTFFGAILGLLIWTIGVGGTGPGTGYGVGATCVFFFPIVMFYRVHYAPPVVAILPTTTVMLVVGYSYQDGHMPALSSVGYGWAVAWRRFVAVSIGVTAAYIFVLIPPRYTQKQTIRLTYAKVIEATGGVLCQTISFANCKGDSVKPPKIIISNVGALRSKVSKTTAAKNFVRYELSLRGGWPSANYDSLQTLQMEILDLIGQFLGVVSSLDTKWTKALLHRTQLDNPRFLGELLTSFQLISASLTHGKPLPMIYNPLLERFLRPTETVLAQHQYGFEVTLNTEKPELDGIPTHVTLETICSLEYLKFSTGVSLIYAIVNRMDRLMFVAKTLVGEDYIVYGLEGESSHLFPAPEGLESRWHGDDSRRNSTDSLV